MADEFVLVAQAFRIHDAVVEHDHAFQRAAAGEAVAMQIFDVLEEADGAGVGDAGKVFRSHFHAEALAADGRMGKVDGAVHTEPGIGERADVLLAVAQFQGAADAHHLAGRGQLTDAGFGIQLISADAQATAEKKTAATTPVQAERTEPRQVPASAPQKPATPSVGEFPANDLKTQQRTPVAPETAVTAPPVELVEQRLPVEPVKAEKVVPTDTVMAAAEPGAVEQTDELSLPTQKAEMRIEPKGNDAPAQDEAPTYTQNTPVEELLQVMTLEQARQVVVDDGICRGMTIAQVAEKRPVNLRFYLIPGKSKNNLVRAAAQLVLDSLQKAG